MAYHFTFQKVTEMVRVIFRKSMQSYKPRAAIGYLQRTHFLRNTGVLFCIKSLVLKADFRIFGVSDISERQWTVQNRHHSHHKIFTQSTINYNSHLGCEQQWL